MAPESYEIDPDGDVLLILRNPRPAFALWNETQDDPSNRPNLPSLDIVDEIFITEPALTKKEKRKRQRRALRTRQVPVPEAPPESCDELPPAPPEPFDELPPAPPETFEELPPAPSETFDEAPPASPGPSDEIPPPAPPETFDEPPPSPFDGSSAAPKEGATPLDEASVIVECVKIRVSSHHLTLASPYYRRMLKGEFKEAETLRKNGEVEVEVKDIDADALVILMKIIHGKTRTVPKEITLEMLAKIAVIVNWYQCYEAVEVFTDMWIAHLRGDLPEAYGRVAVLWICISCVFRQRDEFHSVTGLALKYSSGLVQDLGLPIPQSIFDDIAQRRQESNERIVIALRELAQDLLQDSYGCSFDCRCTLLGALMKAMKSRNFSFLSSANPFSGLNFAEVVEYFRTVRSPRICPEVRWRRLDHYDEENDCNLESRIGPVLDSLKDYMNGLRLEDFASASQT